MKINGVDVKPVRKPKSKTGMIPVKGYCRWESSTANGADIAVHRQFKVAVGRAVQLGGSVRPITYLPDGIVRHGDWRAV
jgi:hypothetical protein